MWACRYLSVCLSVCLSLTLSLSLSVSLCRLCLPSMQLKAREAASMIESTCLTNRTRVAFCSPLPTCTGTILLNRTMLRTQHKLPGAHRSLVLPLPSEPSEEDFFRSGEHRFLEGLCRLGHLRVYLSSGRGLLMLPGRGSFVLLLGSCSS